MRTSRRSGRSRADDAGRSERGVSLAAYLNEPDLTDGQRSRLRVFQGVEEIVGDRVEQLCAQSGLDVTDAAVLVVCPGAHRLFCPPIARGAAPGTSVILGHRERLHAFLHASLPPADETQFDPYVDLIEPSPPQCVRVLIVDERSLTVLSYGVFVTLRLDRGEVPSA
jgi:hypothetical protein